MNSFTTNRHTTVVLVVFNQLFLLDWVVGDSTVVGHCLTFAIGFFVVVDFTLPLNA